MNLSSSLTTHNQATNYKLFSYRSKPEFPYNLQNTEKPNLPFIVERKYYKFYEITKNIFSSKCIGIEIIPKSISTLRLIVNLKKIIYFYKLLSFY